MVISKNTYGVSYVMHPKVINPELINQLGGSSLNRKKTASRQKIEDTENIEEETQAEATTPKLRSMSARTRSKIRNKLLSFARINKNLTFVTLTFVNQVADRTAIKVLRTFLDNAKKRLTDFEYLWVAERQTKNEVFKDNIHFHLVTNRFWKIDKWWPYWLDTQKKFGIVPRDENFKPGSAFNVRKIETANIKKLTTYLTKYVTKNTSEFDCQVWNCSKKISRLYTCFYTGISFINGIERLNETKQLGGELKIIPKEFCNVCVFPLNRITTNFYNKIDDENRIVWKEQNEKHDGK
ncbi:MAG TPA: hypothetical protein VG738_16030 [Chitinophagaceae bacterium]|nr:hypothetical protein [Chitinophagaceae bacterium]